MTACLIALSVLSLAGCGSGSDGNDQEGGNNTTDNAAPITDLSPDPPSKLEVGQEPPTLTCDDFDTQAEAQDYFTDEGGDDTNNVDGLDEDGDGVACESL